MVTTQRGAIRWAFQCRQTWFSTYLRIFLGSKFNIEEPPFYVWLPWITFLHVKKINETGYRKQRKNLKLQHFIKLPLIFCMYSKRTNTIIVRASKFRKKLVPLGSIDEELHCLAFSLCWVTSSKTIRNCTNKIIKPFEMWYKISKILLKMFLIFNIMFLICLYYVSFY